MTVSQTFLIIFFFITDVFEEYSSLIGCSSIVICLMFFSNDYTGVVYSWEKYHRGKIMFSSQKEHTLTMTLHY